MSVVSGALPAMTVTATLERLPAPAAEAASGLEIVFRTDPTLGDGRHANNGWLQELPKPLTKLTWENAVLVSPRTAERLGLSVGSTSRGAAADVVEVAYGGRSVEAAAWIVPGHADDTVTAYLGSGRRRA